MKSAKAIIGLALSITGVVVPLTTDIVEFSVLLLIGITILTTYKAQDAFVDYPIVGSDEFLFRVRTYWVIFPIYASFFILTLRFLEVKFAIKDRYFKGHLDGKEAISTELSKKDYIALRNNQRNIYSNYIIDRKYLTKFCNEKDIAYGRKKARLIAICIIAGLVLTVLTEPGLESFIIIAVVEPFLAIAIYLWAVDYKDAKIFYEAFKRSRDLTPAQPPQNGAPSQIDAPSQNSAPPQPQEKLPKNTVIFGDSYSTFRKFVPEGYAFWYWEGGKPETDVTKVEETWWHQLAKEADLNIILNDSWSGSTIGYYGYGMADCSATSSFIARLRKHTAGGFFNRNKVDTVLIFGGTNDSWADTPLGDIKLDNFNEQDLYFVLPAIAYFIKTVRETLPQAEIYCIANTELKPEIYAAMEASCGRYNAILVRYEHIHKMCGHPTVQGMIDIKEGLLKAMNK